MRIYIVHYRAVLRWKKGINMPQPCLRDVFHLENDLRTTFAILKSGPSTCEKMTFYILHFAENYIELDTISWPKGEKWNRKKSGVCRFSTRKPSVAEGRGTRRGYRLGPAEQAGWNIIIWRILDICLILHEPPSASDLGQGRETWSQFSQASCRFLASWALEGRGCGGERLLISPKG